MPSHFCKKEGRAERYKKIKNPSIRSTGTQIQDLPFIRSLLSGESVDFRRQQMVMFTCLWEGLPSLNLVSNLLTQDFVTDPYLSHANNISSENSALLREGGHYPWLLFSRPFECPANRTDFLWSVGFQTSSQCDLQGGLWATASICKTKRCVWERHYGEGCGRTPEEWGFWWGR